MSQHPYKAVLFDFGGVLASFHDMIGPLRVVKSELGRGVWARLETGEIVPDEIGEQLKDVFNREAPDFADMLFRNRPVTDVMTEDPHFAIALPRIKAAGLRTALLTNNIWLDSARTRPARHEKIFDQFDVIFESCKLGIRKPNAEMFQKAMSALNVTALECVFVDDFEENCKAAEELGMTAVQVHLGKSEQAVAQLEELLQLNLH